MLMKQKNIGKLMISFLLVCLVFSFCVPVAFADDLNGVGSGTTKTEVVQTTPDTTVPTTDNQNVNMQTNTNANTNTTKNSDNLGGFAASSQSPKDVEDTANAIGNMFNQAGPDAEAIEAANSFIAPLASILNKVMAVILGLTSLLMMFITVLDLLYMAFPPIRDHLDGGRLGAANMMGGGRGSRGMGGMRGGMGGMRGGYGMGGGMGGGMMGGMNGGMNGMGGGMMGGGMPGGMNGGMQQQQQVGGGLSAVGRWVSDEAIAACMESQGGAMQGQMGMGGTPVKSMVFSYMKKRAMFLILFGVCLILFTSTVFTDLGVRLGTWILKIILGFGS